MEKLYTCECGRDFEKYQSYVAHCSHCKIHLGDRFDETKHGDRIGNKRAWSKGKKKEHKYRKDLSEILVKGSRFSTIHLKYRLINEGIKEWKCEKCGNTYWLNELIPLELHHKDGDKTNNELDNLELLCPNCHALTDTYRGKNTEKAKTSN